MTVVVIISSAAMSNDKSQMSNVGLGEVAGVVPEADDGAILSMFVAEDGQRGGVQGEVLAGGSGQAEPAGGEDSEEVATGENQDIAFDCAGASEDAVCAGGDLGERFA